MAIPHKTEQKTNKGKSYCCDFEVYVSQISNKLFCQKCGEKLRETKNSTLKSGLVKAYSKSAFVRWPYKKTSNLSPLIPECLPTKYANLHSNNRHASPYFDRIDPDL